MLFDLFRCITEPEQHAIMAGLILNQQAILTNSSQEFEAPQAKAPARTKRKYVRKPKKTLDVSKELKTTSDSNTSVEASTSGTKATVVAETSPVLEKVVAANSSTDTAIEDQQSVITVSDSVKDQSLSTEYPQEIFVDVGDELEKPAKSTRINGNSKKNLTVKLNVKNKTSSDDQEVECVVTNPISADTLPAAASDRSTTVEPTEFTCNICLETFSTVGILGRHLLGHRNITDITCTMCISCKQRTFKTAKNFQMHLVHKHNVPEPRKTSDKQNIEGLSGVTETSDKCDQAEERNQSISPPAQSGDTEVREKVILRSAKRQLFQPDNGEVEKKKRNIKSNKSEEDESPKKQRMKCIVCKRVYNSTDEFDKHVKQYHRTYKKGRVTCGTCKKQFTSPSKLLSHFESVHVEISSQGQEETSKPDDTTDPTYKPEATKETLAKSDKKKKKLNTKENASDDSTQPEKDVKVEQREKIFLRGQPNCILCRRQFNSKPELQEHIKDEHSEKKNLLRCAQCKEDFKTVKSRNNHNNTVHSKHVCPHCQEPQTTKRSLTLHIRNEHAPPVVKDENDDDDEAVVNTSFSYTCDICAKSFATMQQIVDHMKVHEKKQDTKKKSKVTADAKCEWSKCIICLKEFSTQTELTDHIVQVHNKKKKPRVVKAKVIKTEVDILHLPCPLCDKTFHSSSDYIEHVKEHEESDKNKKAKRANKSKRIIKGSLKKHGTYCLNCDKNFKTSDKLDKHYKDVHQHDKFLCASCGKGFSTKYTLKYHVEAEHEGKRFKCTYKKCKETFKRRDTLASHLLDHKGESKYVCTECGQGFFNQQHFQGHVNKHTGNKPYKCPKCDKGFYYKQDVPKHLDICGIDKLEYKCTIGDCKGNPEREYATKTYLQNHEKTYHHLGDPIICNVCGFYTYYKSAFDNHMLLHK